MFRANIFNLYGSPQYDTLRFKRKYSLASAIVIFLFTAAKFPKILDFFFFGHFAGS